VSRSVVQDQCSNVSAQGNVKPSGQEFPKRGDNKTMVFNTTHV